MSRTRGGNRGRVARQRQQAIPTRVANGESAADVAASLIHNGTPVRGRIQILAIARNAAWFATQRPDDVEHLTGRLDVEFIEKRADEKGEGAPFEGRPVGKPEAGEIFTARTSRKREGEISPVLLKRRTG